MSGLERAIEVWWYFFGPVIADAIKKGAAGQEELMSPMLREYVALSTAGASLTYDGLLMACAERDAIREEILRQMEEVTVLVSPVSAGPAFRHGEGNWRRGERENYRDTMRYSQWLNLAGFPGVVVPMALSAEKLPIGVQVIGRPYEEELVLAVAEAVERGTWYVAGAEHLAGTNRKKRPSSWRSGIPRGRGKPRPYERMAQIRVAVALSIQDLARGRRRTFDAVCSGWR